MDHSSLRFFLSPHLSSPSTSLSSPSPLSINQPSPLLSSVAAFMARAVGSRQLGRGTGGGSSGQRTSAGSPPPPDPAKGGGRPWPSGTEEGGRRALLPPRSGCRPSYPGSRSVMGEGGDGGCMQWPRPEVVGDAPTPRS